MTTSGKCGGTRENFKLHDHDSPLLVGHLKETDTLQQGAQKSFLAGGEKG